MNTYKVLKLLKENRVELKICLEKSFEKLTPLLTEAYMAILDDAHLIDKTIDMCVETNEKATKLLAQWKESNFVKSLKQMNEVMSDDDTGLKELMERILNPKKSNQEEDVAPEFLKNIHRDRLRAEIESLKVKIAESPKLSVGCRDFWRIRSNFVLNHEYATQENANRRYQDLIELLQSVLKSEGDKW